MSQTTQSKDTGKLNEDTENPGFLQDCQPHTHHLANWSQRTKSPYMFTSGPGVLYQSNPRGLGQIHFVHHFLLKTGVKAVELSNFSLGSSGTPECNS